MRRASDLDPILRVPLTSDDAEAAIADLWQDTAARLRVARAAEHEAQELEGRVPRTLEAQLAPLAQRSDPEMIFTARLEIVLP